MNKSLIPLILVLFCNSLMAKQDFALPPTDTRPGQIVNGDLFSVKVVPGNMETSFYIVGNKAARFKPQQLKLELFFQQNGETKTVVLKKRGGVFFSKEPLTPNSELKIHTPDGKVDQLILNPHP